jgi:hypothetical protein
LEAMSVAAPMVLSEKSAEGLPELKHKQLHQSAQTFANECLTLLDDETARKTDSDANFSYYQQHYFPQKVRADLLHLFNQLLK